MFSFKVKIRIKFWKVWNLQFYVLIIENGFLISEILKLLGMEENWQTIIFDTTYCYKSLFYNEICYVEILFMVVQLTSCKNAPTSLTNFKCAVKTIC